VEMVEKHPHTAGASPPPIGGTSPPPILKQ
jgi:hypothetical protein